MTKKDYETIANPIRLQVEHQYFLRKRLDKQVELGHDVDRTENEARISELAQLVGSLQFTLSYNDPKFDNDKFRIACGFINN